MSFMNAGLNPANSNNIDAWNTNKIKKGTKVANLDMYSQASEAANERSANSQLRRDIDNAAAMLQFYKQKADKDTEDKRQLARDEVINKSGIDDSQASSKIRLMREEKKIKDETARDAQSDFTSDIESEKARNRDNLNFMRMTAKNDTDRVFNREEADKNRLQQLQMQQSDRFARENLARIDRETQLSDQNSRLAQAAIAAKAQVSTAVLGNRQSYGGYW